jgi:hypothetical protein
MKEKNCFPITIWLSRKAEFDADFESVEKVKKNSREKSYQRKVTENSPVTFWVNFVALFSTDSNSALKFSFCDTHIDIFFKKLLYFHFLLTLKPILDETTQKTSEKSFYKCVLESHFTSVPI